MYTHSLVSVICSVTTYQFLSELVQEIIKDPSEVEAAVDFLYATSKSQEQG